MTRTCRVSLVVVAVLELGTIGLAPTAEGGTSSSQSATAVELGWIHSCALTSAGGVRCWGYNRHNELGDGTNVERWRPVGVSGLGHGVRAITTGARHGCALAGEGVKCWGYNYYGQLGDGTNANRSAAVEVSGLGHGVSAVAAGAFHTCALTSGDVECWGYNGAGQLGDGTLGDRWTPVTVRDLGSDVVAVAGGDSHSCAIAAGGVECWGDNHFGQLGDGTSQPRLTPVRVQGLSGGVTALALGGRHSCALVQGGAVECWGGNAFGQLGDGTTRGRLRPVHVAGLAEGAAAIAAGDGHTCALTKRGAVKCWGYNGWAQLGDGTRLNRTRPAAVSGLRAGVTAIAAGARHTCARTETGNVKCWGYNYNGQLGDGTPDDRLRAVYVLSLGAAPARLSIVSRYATVTPSRFVSVRLRCSAAFRCRGRVWLFAHGRLGTSKFSITRAATAPVRLRLLRRDYDVVVQAGRLRAWARVRYAQADGTTSEQTRPVTLRAA